MNKFFSLLIAFIALIAILYFCFVVVKGVVGIAFGIAGILITGILLWPAIRKSFKK